jgi:hypothetical protein
MQTAESVGPLVGCGDGNTRIVLGAPVIRKSRNAGSNSPEFEGIAAPDRAPTLDSLGKSTEVSQDFSQWDRAPSIAPNPIPNRTLTLEQCDEFRRHPGTFNEMVQAIYSAGYNGVYGMLQEAQAECWKRGVRIQELTDKSSAPSIDSAADAKDAVDIGDGYKLNKDGVVFDPDGKHLIPYSRSKGYLCVSMWQSGKRRDAYVHRLMAETFCTKHSDEQTQVNHRDGDRTNNRLSNLEWCTPGENSMHAARVLFAQKTRAVIGTRLSDGVETRFGSLAEATEHGFIHANIQKVIAGQRRSHAGYTWRDEAIAALQPEGSNHGQ